MALNIYLKYSVFRSILSEVIFFFSFLHFQARYYDGPVTLFRATEGEAEDASITSGWCDYCSDLNVIPVDHDHFSIMDTGSVRFIADYISDHLSQRPQKNAADNNVYMKEDAVDV